MASEVGMFVMLIVLLALKTVRSHFGLVEVVVKDVESLNAYLANVSVPQLDDNSSSSLELIVEFSDSAPIDVAVNLSALAEKKDLNNISLNFNMIRGFVVGPQASPLLLTPQGFVYTNPYARLKLSHVDFSMYDEKLNRLGASCKDYLMSYFGLTSEEEFEAADKRQLLSEFRGPFSRQIPQVEFADVACTEKGAPVCPLVFKDADIYILAMELSIQDNFIRQELFEMSDLDEVLAWAPDFDLNARIVRFLGRGVYRVPLDYLLRLAFLRQSVTVSVSGTLAFMQDERIFRSLPNLRELQLFVYNLREFMHASDNRWLADINYDVRIEPTNWCSRNATLVEANKRFVTALEIHASEGSNEFPTPQEDFCLYRHFPHAQAVFLIMRYDADASCLYWYLSQYYDCFQAFVDAESVAYDADLIEKRVTECAFAARLQLCSTHNFTSEPRLHDVTILDWAYFALAAEFVGPIVTFPLVAIVGFLTNVSVIIVLRDMEASKRRHGIKMDKMYAYLRLNSIFNAIECLLSALTLMNECLGRHSIYCSSIQANYFVQLFKVVVVQYVGECMKTCSILALFAFSCQRYIQSSSSESRLAQKFTDVEPRHFTAAILVFSLLTCVCKLFEYSADLNAISSMELPKMIIQDSLQNSWFQVAYTVHYVFNDATTLLLNLVVDVFLVVHIRCDLKKKAKFGAANDSAKSKAELETRQKEKESTERKTNQLIVYQIIMYLVCRLPELVFYLHLLPLASIPSTDLNGWSYFEYCFDFYLCFVIANVIQYLYSLSYILNVVFIYKFNKSFRLAFRAYFSSKRGLGLFKKQTRS